MKKLLAVVLLLCSFPAFAAITVTSHAEGGESVSAYSFTIASGQSLLLIGCSGYGTNGGTVSTITGGYTLTQAGSTYGTTTYYGGRVAWFYQINPAAGSGTVQCSGTSKQTYVLTFTGTATTSPVDNVTGVSPNGTAPGSITPTAAGDYFLTLVSDQDASDIPVTWTVPTNFSMLNKAADGSSELAGYLNAGTSAVSPSWNMPGYEQTVSQIAIKAATVSPVTITQTFLPGTSLSAYYSQTLTATGGTGSGYIWSINGGGLLPAQGAACAGLSLSAAGGITGTPTTVGTCSATFQVTDSGSNSATATLPIVVSATPLTITTASLPGATVGTAYNTTLAGAGGTGAGYVWSIAGGGTLASQGASCAGLSLSTGGVISGTPTTAGTCSANIQLNDSSNAQANVTLTIAVATGTPALSITTTSLPGGTVGAAYSQTLAATGGTGAGYSWSVTVGSLPAGLTITGAGLISGTPTTAGTSSFTVKVVDSGSNSATQSLAITVGASAPAATPVISPSGGVYASAQTISISDGTTGAVIHYTTDNSVPSCSSATYAAPFSTIGSGVEVVQAIACASGYSDSAVASQSYTVGVAGGSLFR